MSESEPQSPEQKSSQPEEQPPRAAAPTPPAAAAPETAPAEVTAAPAAAVPETPDAPPAPAEPAAPVETAEPSAPPETTPSTATSPPRGQPTHRGTGRRKSAIARVRLVPGDGKVLINNRELDNYFTELEHRAAVMAPLEATGKRGMWSVLVNVGGGGPSGQSGAIKLGVARALVAADESTEPTLRDTGLLTRDARRVERKKYGRRKARRSFQFSKR